MKGDPDVVNQLLIADVYAPGSYFERMTALHAAAEGGHIAILKKRFAAGADVDTISISGQKEQTARQTATRLGHHEFVEALSAAGSKRS